MAGVVLAPQLPPQLPTCSLRRSPTTHRRLLPIKLSVNHFSTSSSIFPSSNLSDAVNVAYGDYTLLLGGVAAAMMIFPPSASAFTAILDFHEPENALSLPTWAIHISSVVEWITAMALVWEYGDRSGYESWKGLSWGMVPLLGGAMCACTWHFFYNAQSLEILVTAQAALTVIGNATMCYAAFRILREAEGKSGGN